MVDVHTQAKFIMLCIHIYHTAYVGITQIILYICIRILMMYPHIIFAQLQFIITSIVGYCIIVFLF